MLQQILTFNFAAQTQLWSCASVLDLCTIHTYKLQM